MSRRCENCAAMLVMPTEDALCEVCKDTGVWAIPPVGGPGVYLPPPPPSPARRCEGCGTGWQLDAENLCHACRTTAVRAEAAAIAVQAREARIRGWT